MSYFFLFYPKFVIFLLFKARFSFFKGKEGRLSYFFGFLKKHSILWGCIGVLFCLHGNNKLLCKQDFFSKIVIIIFIVIFVANSKKHRLGGTPSVYEYFYAPKTNRLSCGKKWWLDWVQCKLNPAHRKLDECHEFAKGQREAFGGCPFTLSLLCTI